MILLDLNSAIIGNIVSYLSANKKEQVSEDLIRHIILNSILYFKKRFNNYGEMIIACDDRNYWRREIFPYYKMNRRESRAKSPLDWYKIFKYIEVIKVELRENFPYKVIQVPHVEADDIIAILARNSELPEPIIIISSDKDFLQLHSLPDIKQWSPITKKFLTTKNPQDYLKEHIFRGDRGDGIPNILSEDNCIMEKVRQTSMREKKIKEWMTQLPERDFVPELLKNYKRNEALIDLFKIPLKIEQQILKQFELEIIGNGKTMMKYFMKHRLKKLMIDIGDFK